MKHRCDARHWAMLRRVSRVARCCAPSTATPIIQSPLASASTYLDGQCSDGRDRDSERSAHQLGFRPIGASCPGSECPSSRGGRRRRTSAGFARWELRALGVSVRHRAVGGGGAHRRGHPPVKRDSPASRAANQRSSSPVIGTVSRGTRARVTAKTCTPAPP